MNEWGGGDQLVTSGPRERLMGREDQAVKGEVRERTGTSLSGV